MKKKKHVTGFVISSLIVALMWYIFVVATKITDGRYWVTLLAAIFVIIYLGYVWGKDAPDKEIKVSTT